jgi:hypothetical protein
MKAFLRGAFMALQPSEVMKTFLVSNSSPWKRCPLLRNAEQLTCLRQVEGKMTGQDCHRCKARRADHQTSAQPGRAGKSILKRIRAP